MSCNTFIGSFHSHSIQGNNIGNEGLIKLAEALKSNSTLSSLSIGMSYCSILFSRNTGEIDFDRNGVINFSEALRSNTTLKLSIYPVLHLQPFLLGQFIRIMKNLRRFSNETELSGNRFITESEGMIYSS
jgi:hypothetical protein